LVNNIDYMLKIITVANPLIFYIAQKTKFPDAVKRNSGIQKQ